MKKFLLSCLCLGGFFAVYAGTGTEADPYTVAEVIAKAPTSTSEAVETGVWVKGYIVGNLSSGSATSAVFGVDGVSASNIIIADAASETDVNNCVSIQLSSGSDVRTAVNLKDNPTVLGYTVTFCGDIMKYCGLPGFKNITAYTLSEGDGTTTEPETPSEKLKFGYVTTVTSGEKYLLVANEAVAAAPLAESYSYGYLGAASVTPADGYIEQTDETNAFTITAVDGGYTIQDSYGRYLYQTTYNSFSVAAEQPTDGAVWSIALQDDGNVKITNNAASKYIQYSTSYSSWGSYNTESGLLPALYQLNATAQDKPTVEVKTEVANIAEFIENADLANAVTITGTVTVVDQAGSYLFVQDATGKMVVYSSSLPTYAKGDQLTGIKGTWSPYNGLPQMKPEDAATFATAVAGTAIEPEVLTLEEIALDNLLAYIKIEGVTVPESTTYSYTITDATGSATMYNSAKITVPTGENLTVVGFISCYNTNVQILPIEITSASGLEVVEAPEISPAGGVIASTQEITITCATEGASIYFTVDGTEPSETNGTLYSTPFVPGKEVTVKAIAVKEGMANSAVVEASYTLLSESTKVATFDFTKPSSLNPVQAENAFGGGDASAVIVNDIVFTAGENEEISLSFAKNSATTDCRIWAGSSAYDLRTYATSTFTIAATNAKILGLEFTGSKTSATTYLTADNGTFEDKVWSGEATAVTFTTVKTTNINTITVTYEADSNGVDAIEVDENAPVEYYNLQGVKVANPQNGLYIRVQGNKAVKVIL